MTAEAPATGAVRDVDAGLDGALDRFEARAMGSPLRLVVHGIARSLAEAAWEAVCAEFAAADLAMSRFRDDSELTALNRRAGTRRGLAVSRRLQRALAAADRATRLTGGRFDARVLPDLERLGYAGARLAGSPLAGPGVGAMPSRGQGPVFWRRPDGLSLDAPADLGGIGKGLTLRWAAGRLVGVAPGASFLLEAGGDLVASGGAPGGTPWLVGIEDPHGSTAPRAVIAVRDGAVATSSVRINRWRRNGQLAHHLVDPRTGDPGGHGLVAVTVAGADPAWSEVWSKTLFLAGSNGIADEARAGGFAAWWIDADGVLAMTPAARLRTVWVRDET